MNGDIIVSNLLWREGKVMSESCLLGSALFSGLHPAFSRLKFSLLLLLPALMVLLTTNS